MALPTRGRIILETTVGEIDIELWSKETPKTCRNLIALAMEGYYDGVIFHRVVPNFLVQTGDRTGTGGGGESFYGEPFEDEIHPRLRFVHRGLVGMANNGTKNSNDSQFFITLDRADELNGKHTLFGRVVGDTFFNVLKIGEMELDDNERPLYPPKIKRVRIVDNPFEDIVPRITAEEKRVQQRAREQAQREREEEQRRRGAKKDVKLLSFGADEEAEEEPVLIKKKPIVRPDLLQPEMPSIPGVPPQSSKKSSKRERPDEGSAEPVETEKKSFKKDKDADLARIREEHEREKAAASNSRKAEIEKMEAEIRKLTRRGAGSDDDEPAQKKPKKSSYLEEEMAKYAKNRGLNSKKGKRKDEGDILATLNSFRSKLKSTTLAASPPPAESGEAAEGAGEDESKPAVEEEEGMEVDDDVGFLGHMLHFPKGNEEEVAKAEREYEVIDPRQRGARAREEERERKRAMKAKDITGGRGYRR
ncbi:cyclophilin-like protein [Lentinus tigrinus ALCF2SS1-7]|uniref:Cyclophilin-like protein n=1 Tax=Lentinus tigrinus ALCF2SS1-6 TaxID=1328759 RepID=A0A5C2SLM8_9APHY|nr:cyclophilin-like protein [Lentinus tigrinus ALCF2SS1-6]RPD76241.1 cyclophilin-like protein [Lentinus tigrinus ALCF2SS1-7]